jgi:ribose-phosphate pyrophosphokinase
MITLEGRTNGGFRLNIGFTKMIYSGGEVSVKLTNAVHLFETITITAHIRNSEDFMTLVMLTDALRRITTVPLYLTMPYFPYARQDRVCNPGEALGARVFADLINSLKFERVTVWDAHSDVTGAVLDRCTNDHCEEFVREIPGVSNMTLVAPDAGAAKKVARCAKLLDVPYVTAHKIRNSETGEISGTALDSDVHFTGDILMVDDICDGGRTFIELAKVIRKRVDGNKKLYLYVTHGIFSRGTQELEAAGIDRIYCPNVWPNVGDPTRPDDNQLIERIKPL